MYKRNGYLRVGFVDLQNKKLTCSLMNTRPRFYYYDINLSSCHSLTANPTSWNRSTVPRIGRCGHRVCACGLYKPVVLENRLGCRQLTAPAVDSVGGICFLRQFHTPTRPLYIAINHKFFLSWSEHNNTNLILASLTGSMFTIISIASSPTYSWFRHDHHHDRLHPYRNINLLN
jgi:hypothetical protein